MKIFKLFATSSVSKREMLITQGYKTLLFPSTALILLIFFLACPHSTLTSVVISNPYLHQHNPPPNTQEIIKKYKYGEVLELNDLSPRGNEIQQSPENSHRHHIQNLERSQMRLKQKSKVVSSDTFLHGLESFNARNPLVDNGTPLKELNNDNLWIRNDFITKNSRMARSPVSNFTYLHKSHKCNSNNTSVMDYESNSISIAVRRTLRFLRN
jgi:hypothetical protein